MSYVITEQDFLFVAKRSTETDPIPTVTMRTEHNGRKSLLKFQLSDRAFYTVKRYSIGLCAVITNEVSHETFTAIPFMLCNAHRKRGIKCEVPKHIFNKNKRVILYSVSIRDIRTHHEYKRQSFFRDPKGGKQSAQMTAVMNQQVAPMRMRRFDFGMTPAQFLRSQQAQQVQQSPQVQNIFLSSQTIYMPQMLMTPINESSHHPRSFQAIELPMHLRPQPQSFVPVRVGGSVRIVPRQGPMNH